MAENQINPLFNIHEKYKDVFIINPYRFTKQVIQDHLILNLDAGNPLSYPGSGTIWTDLSPEHYNGTLVGTLPWSADAGGYFDFAVTGNGVTLGANTPKLYPGIIDYTWSGWLNFGAFTGAYRQIWYGNAGGGNKGFGFNLVYNDNRLRIGIYGSVGGSQIKYVAAQSINTWLYITFVIHQSSFTIDVYINGAFLTTASFINWGSIDKQSEASLTLGYNNSVGTWQYNGKMAAIHAYDKALLSDDVLQNYNCLKGRFGL